MLAERPRILIIDDEEPIRDACTQVLTKAGNIVETAENGRAGLGLLNEFQPYVVLVDLKMPGIGGIEVLEEIEKLDPNIVKVVITGYATIPSAVEAMKKGAYDFIAKPFTPDEIRLLVERAVEKRRLLLESEALKREQERIRKNMISLVSHELRAPLAATVQYLEVILGGMAGDISAEAKDMIQQSDIRLREMLELIRRWLSLATMDTARVAVDFQEISLVDVAEESIELLKPLADEKEVSVSLDSAENPPSIKGSKGGLGEVFNNLISNAIKYNSPGGWARVKFYEEDEEVGVEVIDNGIGIEENHQSRIFDEFYRVDGRRNAPIKGSGLGLSISKKIVDAHGGKIAVEGRSSKGTIFRIHFPKIPSGY